MPPFDVLRRLARLAVAAWCIGIGGCQGMYLHNADRAAVATTARKSIDTVDIAAISKIEQENLARLLEEEVNAIEARSRLVATLAVLDLAASDQSVAHHYQDALQKMELALGTRNMLDLQNASDCKISLKAEVGRNQVHRVSLVSGYGVKKLPACEPKMPQSIPYPDNLPESEQKKFAAAYQTYAKSCETIESMCKSPLAGGEFEAARKKAEETRATIAEARNDLKVAREAYEAALKANKDRSQAAASTAKDLQDKADDLLGAVNKLAKVSPSAANQIKGSALVDLLTAAAGGKADSTDADLAPALEIAKSIPSLAQSINTARAQRAQVPVSHLLLALNNLTIQAERDERLRALDEEEISVHERKADAMAAQADLWKEYSNSLCNLVLLSANKAHPNRPCATIGLPEKVPDPPAKVSCTVSFAPEAKVDPVPVDDCVLGKSWRALFTEDLKSDQSRQLNEAAAAYLHARLIAYNYTVEEFRRIAIDHRRAAVRSEAALRQWKNLVSVPASELEGYYGGGIKPEALADFIVKAFGFTAIAIGVAQ